MFIDGDDDEQVKWAMQQQGDIILVKGSPLELNKQHDRWFYFDQAAFLTSKFGITQVPARVSQEGLQLKIEELQI